MVEINGTRPKYLDSQLTVPVLLQNQYMYEFVLEHLKAQLCTLLLYKYESAECYVTL